MFFKKKSNREKSWIIEGRQIVASSKKGELVLLRIKLDKPVGYAMPGTATLKGRINNCSE